MDQLVLDQAAALSPTAVRNPIAGLIQAQRVLYKVAVEIDRASESSLHGELVQRDALALMLESSTVLTRDVSAELRLPQLQLGDLILDVPHKGREGGHDEDARLLIYDRGTAHDPFDAKDAISPTIHAQADAHGHHIKVCRVFVHPALHEDLRITGRLKEFEVAIRRSLRTLARA